MEEINNFYRRSARDESGRCISGRDYLQTRQSSGAVGNGAEGREGTSPLDCTPRTSMTAVTTSELSMQPSYDPAGACSDVQNLQHRRQRQQQQQEPEEISLTQPTDTAASSSSIRDESVVRTPHSANVILSLPASPKRSSASHSSSSKTPAISKSQMKGEPRFKIFFSSPIVLKNATGTG